MFRSKKAAAETLATGSGDLNATFQTHDVREFSVQINYGAGSSTIAKLQSSVDGTNFVDYPDSELTLDTGGGSHEWSVRDWTSLYCKVVIDGDAVSNSIIVAKRV